MACPLGGGCADVLTSEYANFLGVVPLPVLGEWACCAAARWRWRWRCCCSALLMAGI